MKAVNLTLAPVELSAVNGAGMLLAADDQSGGAHERELVEVTPHEESLAKAGRIALVGEAPTDRYDDMDRPALEAEAESRELDVQRADGRTDRAVPLTELRHALRAHDTATGGAS